MRNRRAITIWKSQQTTTILLLQLLFGLIWFSSCLSYSEARRRRWFGRRKDVSSPSSNQETCQVAYDPLLLAAATSQTTTTTTTCPKEEANNFGKWFSQYYELPESAVSFLSNFKAIVMHEPPVGIVAVLVAVRLLWTGRIFTVYDTNKYKSVDGVLTREETKTRKRRHFISLDTDDVLYDLAGGVERVRRQLCWSALNGVLLQKDRGNESPQLVAAVDALSVSYNPKESRYTFVEEMIEPLSRLETVLMDKDERTATSKTPWQKKKTVKLRDRWETPQTDMAVVLQMAAKTAEIRALDALLRVSRDQLVTTSSRLFRNRKHWKRRVTLNSNLSWFFDRLMKASIEGDRTRLAFAEAAFQSEVTRLGSVTQVLVERPNDMSEKTLVTTLSKSHNTNQTANKTDTSSNGRKGPSRKKWGPRSLVKALPKVSKYSLRFNAEGKGRLSLRVYDGETTIRSDVAWNELLHNDQVNPLEWIEQAHDWTEKARTVLCNVLRETVETSVSDSVQAKQDLDIIDKWCTYDCGTCLDLDKQWLAILNLVDNLDSLKRVGEGREIGIMDSGIRLWMERLDVFGIPTALAAVGIAKLLHNYLLPYWPAFKRAATNAVLISLGIVKQRFWVPFYNIVQGLMNKDTGLLEAFDIENEEQSLDNMLEDLGLGDGSAATRKEALQSASRLYEDQLEHGVIRSAVRGKLVRLLLIQVQQLKAGLLHAMSSIDVLVAANRLNIQILAAIPAVLIVYFGTQVIVRSLYTLRAKDIRPIRDVHAEMADYLDELELTFLLATPVEVSAVDETARGTAEIKETISLTETMQPIDLGASVLRIHAYLVLLNYCGPLFPYRATSSIRRSMQELVGSYKLGTERQVALLRLIKQKHMDLLKYL